MEAEQSTFEHRAVKDQATDPIALLLVGKDDAFENPVAHRFLGCDRFRLAGRSTTLLGGLAQLQAEPIDLVLLSAEFPREELSLFALDAHRKGFAGMILHVAYLPYAERQADPTSFTQRQPLTAKQRAVLRWVSEGWSNQDIARELSHSEGAVKAILQQLFNNFGVRKRVQLIRLALLKNDPEALATSARFTESTYAASRPANLSEKLSAYVELGDFRFDLERHQTWIKGRPINLSRLETKLLTFFARHPEELLSHEELVSAIWENHPVKRESLRVLVQSLRTKVETTTPPQYILTKPYYGYRFVPTPQHLLSRASSSN
jgi:DNA-binding response OmpR family regulator